MRLFVALLAASVLTAAFCQPNHAAAQERSPPSPPQAPVNGTAETPAVPAWLEHAQRSLADLVVRRFLADAPETREAAGQDSKSEDDQDLAQQGEPATRADPAPIHRCDRLAASMNDPYAVVDGISIREIDAAEAVPACEDAVRQFPEQLRFTFQLGRAFHAAGQYDEGARWFGVAAKAGHAGAMSNLGTLHRMGKGVPQGYEEAFYWFSRAAHAGEPYGMTNLGLLYREGNGVPRDDAQAVRWFRQAAGMGVPFAMRMLGEHFADGLGVSPDPREAARWYRQAAQSGDVTSMSELASAYAAGRGVPKDEGEAARWYKASADLGSVSSKRELAWMFLNGRGVPQDDDEAARLYLEAAEANSRSAMFALGELYLTGRGLGRDEVAAATWYRRSAEGGFADAMTEFAFMLDSGQGVDADPIAGADWVYRALRAGSYEATARLRAGDGSAVLRGALRTRLEAEDYPPEAIDWLFPASYRAE